MSSSPKLNHTFGRDMSKESDGNISDSRSYSEVVSGRMSKENPSVLSVLISQTQESCSVRSDGTKKSSHISNLSGTVSSVLYQSNDSRIFNLSSTVYLCCVEVLTVLHLICLAQSNLCCVEVGILVRSLVINLICPTQYHLC